MITLYTTHCPNCRMLEIQLKQHNIKYVEKTNIDEMLELGFDRVPVLQINEDKFLNYEAAKKWIDKQEVNE